VVLTDWVKIVKRRWRKRLEQMKLNVVSFSVAQSENPDFMKFDAVVGYVDTPTDATPGGGIDGYQLVIRSEGMDVRSLVGSGVNVAWYDGWFEDSSQNLKGHDARFKVGVIDSAQVVGNQIMVSGHLWKYDFPDVCDTIECAKESLGCSVEAYFDGFQKDDDTKILTGFGARFTGVAILYKNKAAFKSTKVMCSIQEQEEDNLNEETKKALEAMFSEQNKAFEAKFEAINEAMEKFEKQVAELSTKTENETADENADENNKVELSAVAQVVADAIKEGFESMRQSPEVDAMAAQAENKTTASATATPARKTAAFSTTPQMSESKEKTAMELAAEIDADENLTPDQKWAKKVDLWNEHRAEFKNA
jgi:hypothetical protein